MLGGRDGVYGYAAEAEYSRGFDEGGGHSNLAILLDLGCEG